MTRLKPCHYFMDSKFHTRNTCTVTERTSVRQFAGHMSTFNLTALGFDQDLFFAINSSVNELFFLVLVLPATFLNVLCVMALLLAKNIKWQIKVVLINVFAADLILAITLLVLVLSYPIRAYLSHSQGLDYLCSVLFGSIIISFQSNLTAVTYYAIVVYIYLRYGVRKLKWYVTALFISITWLVSILIGFSVIFNGGPSAISSIGFCVPTPMQNLRLVALAVLLVIEVSVCLCVTITFVVLAYCYIKKNTLEDNFAVKKAMVRTLLFHSMKMIVLVVRRVLAIIFPILILLLDGRARVIVYIAMNYSIILILLCINLLVSPIVSLVILQPLREALKQFRKKLCSRCCCKKNAVHPTLSSNRRQAVNVAHPLPRIMEVVEMEDVGQTI